MRFLLHSPAGFDPEAPPSREQNTAFEVPQISEGRAIQGNHEYTNPRCYSKVDQLALTNYPLLLQHCLFRKDCKADSLKICLKARKSGVSCTADLFPQPACITLTHHESYAQPSTKPLRGAESSETSHAAKAGPQCQAAMHGAAEGEGCCCPVQGGANSCTFHPHCMCTEPFGCQSATSLSKVLPGCHGDVNRAKMPD